MNGEARGVPRAVVKARIVVGTALADPGPPEVWGPRLLRLPADDAKFAVVERLSEGRTDPWEVTRLMEAVEVVGLAHHESFLLAMTADPTLPLAARGLAFEVFAQHVDQVSWLNGVRAHEPMGDGRPTPWLQAFLAGVALRGEHLDATRRFTALCAWHGGRMLFSGLDRARRTLGLPAARVYRTMLLEPDLEWARADMLEAIEGESPEAAARLFDELVARAPDRRARRAFVAARRRLRESAAHG